MSQKQLNRHLFWAVRDAICNNNLEGVKKAIDDGAEIKAKDEDSTTLLHLAASLGNIEIVKLLINQGANVNARDINGYTPLRAPAYFGKLDIGNLLIDHGGKL